MALRVAKAVPFLQSALKKIGVTAFWGDQALQADNWSFSYQYGGETNFLHESSRWQQGALDSKASRIDAAKIQSALNFV
ncbi:hypothetical protein JF546_13720 [Nitratireductor aquimarinus]|uniref:hypothetical protein n=1 Tax=Nitratireductor aquimarinus TaxID=889300 RepID=UPI001A8C0EA8|nr:hypothetical protein [Nitratireductor aquimarinus]MBN8244073.1 hypothetical protein [Nitratireductor aquimarinus]MBY6131607.1 hypothetical protein [Nitratireductor aquimarinus]MCA1301142.1 hypothetical protein [Nitratireductor aquimarinus]